MLFEKFKICCFSHCIAPDLCWIRHFNKTHKTKNVRLSLSNLFEIFVK